MTEEDYIGLITSLISWLCGSCTGQLNVYFPIANQTCLARKNERLHHILVDWNNALLQHFLHTLYSDAGCVDRPSREASAVTNWPMQLKMGFHRYGIRF